MAALAEAALLPCWDTTFIRWHRKLWFFLNVCYFSSNGIKMFVLGYEIYAQVEIFFYISSYQQIVDLIVRDTI